MKKRLFSILFGLVAVVGLSAQNAKAILDKSAAALSKGAVTASFTTSGAMGSSSGSLTAQGSKFVLHSSAARIWFDGKTEWALAAGSNEVNVSNPTAAEIATLNPMNYVSLYKRGYTATASDKGAAHQVRLVAQNPKAGLAELLITINKGNHLPSQVKVRSGKQWTTISVASIKVGAKQKDAFFRFNPKAFPKVDIIDLR